MILSTISYQLLALYLWMDGENVFFIIWTSMLGVFFNGFSGYVGVLLSENVPGSTLGACVVHCINHRSHFECF